MDVKVGEGLAWSNGCYATPMTGASSLTPILVVLLGASATACGPGLADPAPWLDVPAQVDAELVPNVAVPVPISVTNVGTESAYIRANATGGAELPEARFRLPPGERTELLVWMTANGYGSVDGQVHLVVREELHTVRVHGDVPSDLDGDGYDAVVVGGTDCDDQNPDRSPGMSELCNGIDDDCNGQVDEGLPEEDFWFDGDDDGFGDAEASPVSACRAPVAHTDNDDDCDDDDPDVSPAASERWYDGFDEDCDGHSDYDQDFDGFDALAHGGLDCDDEAGTVYPDATELDDGLDNDCDSFRDEDIIRPGDLVITELFVDPLTGTPTEAEWVELVNTSTTHADLALVRFDVHGANTFLSEEPKPLPPSGVWLVCSNASEAANGGVENCGTELTIPTAARGFALLGPDDIIDDVDATGWTFTPGRALELGETQLDSDLNDDETSWCPAVSLFGDAAGDRGTPGVHLPPCP